MIKPIEININFQFIDSLVLHSPMRSLDDTLNVWKRFEAAVSKGVVGILGISNIYDPSQLKVIFNKVNVKPKVIQNRYKIICSP